MIQMTVPQPTQQVFERVIVQPVTTPDTQHGRLVHIDWSAPDQGGRLVQFYDNNALVGCSRSPEDLEAWLVLDAGAHHQIELLAVRPQDAATPSQQYLAGVDPPTRPSASASVLRALTLPIDADLRVRIDTGQEVTAPLFSPDTPRGGFGAVFGAGGFGYDASAGPGLGLGQLGFGPLGIDGDALVWRDDSLARGDHTIELSLLDKSGQPAATPESLEISTSRLPAPPTNLSLSPALQLTWT